MKERVEEPVATMRNNDENRESADLEWLAHRYVLGELDPGATEAFEARLATDEDAAIAMASAVRVLAALGASRPAASCAAVMPAMRSSPIPGWWWAAGALATAVALSAIWLVPTARDVGGLPEEEAANLVAAWSATNPDTASPVEVDREDEENADDALPEWLLVAVSLEERKTGDTQVIEN